MGLGAREGWVGRPLARTVAGEPWVVQGEEVFLSATLSVLSVARDFFFFFFFGVAISLSPPIACAHLSD